MSKMLDQLVATRTESARAGEVPPSGMPPADAPSGDPATLPGPPATPPGVPGIPSSAVPGGMYVPKGLEGRPTEEPPEYNGPRISQEEPNVSEDVQASYDKDFEQLFEFYYGDTELTRRLANAINPRDKMGSLIQTSLLALVEVDRKADFDMENVANLTSDAVEMMVDIAAEKGITYNDTELQQALAATWEGMVSMFGESEGADIGESYAELTGTMTPEEIAQATAQYQSLIDATPESMA